MSPKIKNLLILSLFLVPVNSFTLEATYYADSFEWGGTADGSKFSQEVFSAAACDVELGQYGYVRYGNTGAVVTINDRPNCRKHPEIIDLSRRAFEIFAPTSVGRISDTDLSIIGKNVNSFPKKNLDRNTFANLGIRLTSDLSNTYFTDESILIQGKVTIKKEYALIYLEEKSTKKKVVTELAKTDKNGNFSFLLQFPKNGGEYYLIVAGGNSFETTEPTRIKLVQRDSFMYPDIPTVLRTFHPIVSGGENPVITLPDNLWASMRIIRDGKTFLTEGSALSFQGISFTPGKAQVSIDGYVLSTPSSLDRSQYISKLYSGSVILDRTHESIGREKVLIRTVRQNSTFRFRLKSGEEVRSKYYVTLPNGDVREYDIAQYFVEPNGLLKTGIWISGSFPTRDPWSYKLEFVQADGFAYVNIPLYQGTVWSVLPTITESEKTTLRKQFTVVEKNTLAAINKIRAWLGRNLLMIDDTLAELAQAKAENMANDDYVGHYTKGGQDILSFAKSRGIKITGSVGENVAGGNVSDIALQDGLEESGSHRYNMIDPSWTKAGIGYALKDGKVYMVQVFGE
jgi:uncharacterized protein YkwD